MKINEIIQKILLTVLHKIKMNPKTCIILLLFPVLFLFVCSIGITQKTIGRFSQAFFVSDSALAAKFNVVITATEEFTEEQDENLLEYHFLSALEIKGFDFQVFNNGEEDIICIPQVSNEITHRFFISGVQCSEFIVRAKETVNFRLLIAPDGLDGNTKEAAVFIDIQQIERS